MKKWIDYHLCKQDRKHILFCSLVEPHGRLTDAGLRDQLVKIAGKAGINKSVNPHRFRHARATHMAAHMTEEQLKKYLGWTAGSNMAAIYVHLSGKDIDNAVLNMNGLDVEERQEENALKTIKCPRCKQIQDARNESCHTCWLSFKSDIDSSIESQLLAMKEEIEQMKKEKEEDKLLKATFLKVCGAFVSGDFAKTIKDTLKKHEYRLRIDSEYRRKFNVYSGHYIFERFRDPNAEHEHDVYRRNEEVKKSKFNNTLDKLRYSI